MSRKAMMEKLGLTEDDFSPKKKSVEDEIKELKAIIQEQDEALMELAMLLTEVKEDG